MILLLFTSSYPYDIAAEQTFLEPEIAFLIKHFHRVIIVPQILAGKKLQVPDGVQVEESYAATLQANNKKVRKLPGGVSSWMFYDDLVHRPAVMFKPGVLKRLIGFTADAKATKRWVYEFVANSKLDPARCVFYTYWLGYSALGIGLAKETLTQIRLVSRAHGNDLYEERHTLDFIPCRQRTLKVLDGLFPDSESGKNYLIQRYPQFARLIATARLGVPDPGFVTSPSGDQVFRIVSCSFFDPIKRIDLMLKGIARAAELRPNQRFEWRHFGTGALKSEIESLANETFSSNVSYCFPGYSILRDMMAFYKDNPIDVFMNVSESEGTPVSVMEAISCGIPVIATSVGGNPEIVTEQNGILVSAYPTPDEIARAIFEILDNPASTLAKREGSRKMWDERYNAGRNFQAFVASLKQVRMQS